MRIVIIAHSFHRRASAALRSWNLARAMAADGVEVGVFCMEGPDSSDGPAPDGVRIRCVKGPASRTLVDRVEARLPDWAGHRHLGWLARRAFTALILGKRRSKLVCGLAGAIRDAHRETPFDFLIGIWPVYEPLWAGAAAAKRTGIPWAVEFQDPWTSFYPPELRGPVQVVLRDAVRAVRFLINVCPVWCRQDERDFGKRTVCIPTGFWPMEVARLPPNNKDPMRIVYTGELWCFDYRMFVAGLALAQQRGYAVEFGYYGYDGWRLRKVFEELGCASLLVDHGRVTTKEAYVAQGRAEALLLFTMPSKPSTFGYKFAEVVSHGLPVLLVGPTDQEVEGTASELTRVLPCRNAGEVADTLERLNQARPIQPAPRPSAQQYTWDKLARRLRQAIAADLEGGIVNGGT